MALPGFVKGDDLSVANLTRTPCSPKEKRTRCSSPIKSTTIDRPRSRSRSGHVRTPQKEEPAPDHVATEIEATLPNGVRERLQKLKDEGVIGQNDFDSNALFTFKALSEALQIQVLEYLVTDNVFFINSRSKSGFLVAACDKAGKGMLDVRGYFLPDPWRTFLSQFATPRRQVVDLVPEQQWLSDHGDAPVRLSLDVMADHTFGVPSIALSLKPERCIIDVKRRLVELGAKIPLNKMKLKQAALGFLRDDRSLAFYNLQSGTILHLVWRTRAGVALKRDHSA